jgi:Mce-associated membrane protein
VTGTARRGLVVAAVVSVLLAAWFGWSWWSAAHDDGLAVARDRDGLLSAAGNALVVLNTIDYRTGPQDVDRWLQVTTGQLGKDLGGDRQSQLDRANTTKTVATATLDQAAVTQLNSAAGTAELIALLTVRVSTGGGAPASKLSRLTVETNRTVDGWKVSAVQAGTA